MRFPKASQEDLEPQIVKFMGTGRGAIHFDLIGKYCRDKSTVSTTSKTIGNVKYLQKAVKFFSNVRVGTR